MRREAPRYSGLNDFKHYFFAGKKIPDATVNMFSRWRCVKMIAAWIFGI